MESLSSGSSHDKPVPSDPASHGSEPEGEAVEDEGGELPAIVCLHSENEALKSKVRILEARVVELETRGSVEMEPLDVEVKQSQLDDEIN